MSACLHCRRPFAPKHSSQKFCSPVNGRRVCKDAHHAKRSKPKTIRGSGFVHSYTISRRIEVETKDGVAVPPGFVGITDQEHDEIMSQDRDDF